MSRFTRPPFHKPSPFDIPRPVHPISPPETDVTLDSVTLPPMSIVSRDTGLGSFAEIGASSAFTRVDTPESYHTAAPPSMDTESQTYSQQTQQQYGRFRPRPSNLGYLHHPGSVRSDYVRAAPRTATRWLVMVIPPPAIAREHGTGTFLNGSSPLTLHSSHAVLLPLLPSFSGQLSAIAREFGFPSTSGICISLHMSDGGVQFAPRISDESWSILWGAAFDERQSVHAMGGLPIAGRIEFDLDLRKARWFDVWLSSLKRGSVDASFSSVGGPGPGTFGATSHHHRHRREGSRTTTFEQLDDAMGDDVSVTTQRKVLPGRHVPRKLSILDRVDVSATIRPSPRPSSSRLAHSPIDAEHREHSRVLLSPVIPTSQGPIPVPIAVEDESEEPPTAEAAALSVDVEKKVETWRASSTFAKSPLALTGQTALDPANMPNNQPLVEIDAIPAGEELKQLNLDDFTWSISSAGPLSTYYHGDVPLYFDEDRPPSVHLDARLEGSVCMTPTTCTSWGAPDYDPFSPVTSLIDRLPSPDIAARQYEDAPPTPTTATSWGPPSPVEWSESPASLFRAPSSVDIASRQLGSRPVTPSTATSWGAPLEWPDSPAESFRASSIDIAARQLDSRPVTPSTATSWGAPLEWPASPEPPFYMQTPGVGHMFFDGQDEEHSLLERGRALRATASGDDEPPRSVERGIDDVGAGAFVQPWKFVWPYRETSSPVLEEVQSRLPSTTAFSFVYPHFDLYPTPLAPRSKTNERPPPQGLTRRLQAEVASTPVTKPWKLVWPYKKVDNNAVRPVDVRLPTTYPSFDIYPAVYPNFDLYPAKPILVVTGREVDVHLQPRYPVLSIYPTLYPNFEIYPGHVVKAQRNPLEVRTLRIPLQNRYPIIRPYPPIYPHFDLYPSTQLLVVKMRGKEPPQRPASLPRHERSEKPKASPWKHVWPYQHVEDVMHPVDIQGPASMTATTGKVSTMERPPRKPSSTSSDSAMQKAAPWQHVWPYQHIHAMINPTDDQGSVTTTLETVSTVERPPPHKPSSTPSDSATQKAAPWKHVWPYLRTVTPTARPVNINLERIYPSLDIYPDVYPHFDLYPAKPAAFGTSRGVSLKLEAKYPAFSIYPAVYPNLVIYPGHVVEAQRNREGINMKLRPSYPSLEIYAPVYPHLVIYPEVAIDQGKMIEEKQKLSVPLAGAQTSHRTASEQSASRLPIAVTLKLAYPSLDIYPAVYPYFDIYRSGKASTPKCQTDAPSVALKPKYPLLEIYPPVYPYFDVYKAGQVSDPTPLATKLSTKLRVKYPGLDIHPVVYPNFEIYPSVKSMAILPPQPAQTHAVRRSHKSHQELADIVLSQVRTESQNPPIISVSSAEATRPRKPRRTHRELVELVFPPGPKVTAAPLPRPNVYPREEIPVVRQEIPIARHRDEETLSRPRRPADVPQDVGSAASSSPSNSVRSSRPPGLPVRPSEIRRSVSLQQGTMSSSSGIARSQSLGHDLPSVREEREGPERHPSGLPTLRRPQIGLEKKRDSLVLERARRWGETRPSRQVPTHPSSRLSMGDQLSEFPMPPLSSVPGLASGVRPLSSSSSSTTSTSSSAYSTVNQPVAKLDRTKFPFR